MHGKPDHNPNTPTFVGDSEVDLSDFDLSRANLKEANLHEANLFITTPSDANLGGANLMDAILRSARYDEDTQWPEGFDPEAAGAILEE